MIKVEHMGVSPSQAKSKKENHFCPEESTSEQAHEFGSEYLLAEISENKDQNGYMITQNESAEIATGVSHSSIHKPSSEYVANNSSPKHLEVLPKGVSEHHHTDQSFCHQETASGKTHEYGSGYACKETSEKKHHLGSEIVQNKLQQTCTLVCDLPAKHLQPFSKDLSKNATTESLGWLPEDSSKNSQTDKLSCPKLGSLEPTVCFGSGNICKEFGESPEQQQQLDSQSLPNGIEKSTAAVSANVFNQALQLNLEDLNKGNCGNHLESPSKGASNVVQTSKCSLVDPIELPQEFALGNPSSQQPRLHCEDKSKNSGAEQHETTPKNLLKNSGRRRDGKTSKTIKKKYMLRSLTSSDRVLRSKSQEKSKASQTSNNLDDVRSSKQQKRRKRKRKEKREVADEYSRLRTHLRYLLNRINYEQSLIAAYSTEGWKGLSLEKLKPEKELQRAKSEILRRKLKIRDLFQHIDSLCAEGRLSESLFDSEGQIDSEDIFCAKCGSKDLSANNDIILCDGACDRGFHQYCLQPPLLKEDIPPDDEGWLCPGCDCKVDCIELVNESQGTNFSLTDSWEKIFPEAAVAAGGQNQDTKFGLPSDDSDDNDYNPDSSETNKNDQGDESSSDESDFTSTSEELGVPANVDPYLGLPSDDSEDDDYDPDGPDHDNEAKPESSSSDFTSDSEDLGATLEDNLSSPKDEGCMSNNASKDSKGQKPELGGKKFLNDELLSIMESASGQEGAMVSKKRSIQRLDYKRLYDETYGSVPSSYSDDEDWGDTMASRKRKKRNAEAASAPSNGNASVTRSVLVCNGLKPNAEESEHKTWRKTRQKSNFKYIDTSPSELQVLKPNLEETEHKPQRKTWQKSNFKDTDISPSELQSLKPNPEETEHIYRRKTRQKSKFKDTEISPSELQGLKPNPEETEHKPGRKTRQKTNFKDTDISPSELQSLKLNTEETEDKPGRKTRQKSNFKNADISPSELQGGASASSSSGKKRGSSTYRRLGEDVKQRLYKSFKQNQYPDRHTKESLAKELGMTFRQVSKWFENARRSFNNSSSVHETAANEGSGNDVAASSALPKKNRKRNVNGKTRYSCT